MLGAEIDGKIANASFWHAELSAFAPAIRGCPSLTSFSGRRAARMKTGHGLRAGDARRTALTPLLGLLQMLSKCQMPTGLWLFLKPSSQILARQVGNRWAPLR
jgi:hypothetical protein